MKRGYSYEGYREKVKMLRSEVPGIAITTDIITGFPGETGDDHRRTVNALKEIEFDGIFAFKYSPREGTKAAAMDCQVADEIKSERIAEILEVQDVITLKINETFENTVQEILVEGPSETDLKMLTGRTRSNKVVNFEGNGFCIGTIVAVRVVKARKHSLDGVLL
jgi:tRNA-2-methylthio-N6-dimethylallyladenosine synthase